MIGTGTTFSAALSALGTHVMTLAATDSNGYVGTDPITITLVLGCRLGDRRECELRGRFS